MSNFFNTGLTQQQFLDEFWQKKPLLIRQAFADFETPISPEELAGLACEPEIESRLIEERGQEGKAWQVSCGPLSDDDFARLPETHWTLLVQDVDKHLPELQYLLDPFRFIPDWRRDDLMISYAPEFGTVGPHTDGYDVFLLQAMGARRWQIGDQPIHEAKLIDGLELQILAEFKPDQSWDLQPGDLLYLPPNFAHHGVALNDCMTFSVGFRAATQVEVLDAVVNNLLEQQLGKVRYSDSNLLLSAHGSEVDEHAVERLKKMLHQAIDNAEPILTQTLGKVATETKPSLLSLASEYMTGAISKEELERLFSQGEELHRNHYLRFAWSENNGCGQLYMAGQAYEVDKQAVGYLTLFTEQTTLTPKDWKQIKLSESAVNLLAKLIEEGGWFWQDT